MFAGVAVAGPFEDGLTAYGQGHFNEAVSLLVKAAEQGDIRAQYQLGTMYDLGQGVPEDLAEAARWYRMAAEQGVVAAQFHIGAMHLNGQGVLQDHVSSRTCGSISQRRGGGR